MTEMITMTAITMNGNCWVEQPVMGYHGEPFRWDEVRRAQVRAELDAYYASLYGPTVRNCAISWTRKYHRSWKMN